MTSKAKNRLRLGVFASLMVLIFMMPVANSLASDRQEALQLKPGESNWVPPVFQQGAQAVIMTTSLNVITPLQMVSTLLNTTFPDPVISVQNITYAGNNLAGGTFTGALAPIGIPHGAILSTGKIASVVGGPFGACNTQSNTTTWWGLPGDADVGAITGKPTFDAAILTFQIRSAINQDIAFVYVFGSECYNEWVYTPYNDGFGLWIDALPVPAARTNYALIPNIAAGLPVTIDNVNWGNSGGGPAATNPAWYVNNHCGVFDLIGTPFPCGPPNRETELDGLTQHPLANPLS
ncbi:MAG: choice-of-anchor L domain-containing protein, partial [Gammaproteobacteria bacterium]|nr:choice-of-anchor L domain-containing protein [Gammaproteobacteria bacterium]